MPNENPLLNRVPSFMRDRVSQQQMSDDLDEEFPVQDNAMLTKMFADIARLNSRVKVLEAAAEDRNPGPQMTWEHYAAQTIQELWQAEFGLPVSTGASEKMAQCVAARWKDIEDSYERYLGDR
jgi:hypothetical protein